jgi:hypothetical protein
MATVAHALPPGWKRSTLVFVALIGTTAADLPLVIVGKGNPKARANDPNCVSWWGPNIIVTNSNETLLWASCKTNTPVTYTYLARSSSAGRVVVSAAGVAVPQATRRPQPWCGRDRCCAIVSRRAEAIAGVHGPVSGATVRHSRHFRTVDNRYRVISTPGCTVTAAMRYRRPRTPTTRPELGQSHSLALAGGSLPGSEPPTLGGIYGIACFHTSGNAGGDSG